MASVAAGLIGVWIVRNAPDFSVDADRGQEPAANRPKSGDLDRRRASLCGGDAIAGVGLWQSYGSLMLRIERRMTPDGRFDDRFGPSWL
jgi:hypothetical protein